MDALRSALQPIMHNLPGPIRDLGVSLIGDACYQALVLDVDPVNNGECLRLAVSKALGVGIVGASAVVKVPQLAKLVRSRSASGVSFLAYLLETSSYLVSLAYNVRRGFPFSTYGETAFVLVQNVAISVLVLNYSGRSGMAALFVAALATSVVTLFAEDLLDMQQLGYLQAGAGALGVASKVPQILAIWQEGGTGQLSAFTVSNEFGCSEGIFFVVSELAGADADAPTGLQLPPRLARARLYDAARGGRQADPVRVRRGLRAELSAGAADALLLECSVGQGKGQAEGSPGLGACVGHDDSDTEKQRPDNAAPRLVASALVLDSRGRGRGPRCVLFLLVNHKGLHFLCVVDVLTCL